MNKKSLFLIFCISFCILTTSTVYASEIDPVAEEQNPSTTVKYKIARDAVAPVPDPTHFGSLPNTSGSKLDGIIAYARQQGLLGTDEDLIFNPNANFYSDKPIDFYFDDSILAICWKEKIGTSMFTFAEIKIADPSQFRRKLAGSDPFSANRRFCSEMVREANAVVGMNADFANFRNLGTTCYNGLIYRDNQSLDTLFIDIDGDFHVMPRGTNLSHDELQQYALDNNIQFSLTFGPTLIQDGQVVVPANYPIGEINDCYSRAAIAQVDKLHYLYANISSCYGGNVTTLRTFANNLNTKKIKTAYTLDGGQTTELIFNNQIMHYVVYGKERTVSDIIYFATAIPNEN